MDSTEHDMLAFMSFSAQHRAKISSTSTLTASASASRSERTLAGSFLLWLATGLPLPNRPLSVDDVGWGFFGKLALRRGDLVFAGLSRPVVAAWDGRAPLAFFPQSIPFYAAQQVFDRLVKDFPDYSFRQPAPNPTNPTDKPAPWEAGIIDALTVQPTLASLVTQRATPAGDILSYAEPVRTSDKGCLTCHSTPEAAPRSMIDRRSLVAATGLLEG